MGAVRRAGRLPPRGGSRSVGALRRSREPCRLPHAAARLLLCRPACRDDGRRHDRRPRGATRPRTDDRDRRRRRLGRRARGAARRRRDVQAGARRNCRRARGVPVAARGGAVAPARAGSGAARIATTEYKLKYAESALGYVWSIAKPLAMFAVIYTVFGRFFKLNVGFERYPLYLLIGIVLWVFFVDATGLAMTCLVARASLLRKLAFPHLVIPLSVTLSAGLTFLVNLLVVAVFVGTNHIRPQFAWLWIPLLLIELFVFTLGVGLVLAAAFVRL